MLLFIFANDSKQTLASLEEEEVKIRNLMEPLREVVDSQYVRHATITTTHWCLRNWHQQIRIFHFAGHSSPNSLYLLDGEAFDQNISIPLGQAPNLKLVFLNGCKNRKQVKNLHKRGVEAVIATSSNVEDGRAAAFAESFYESMRAGSTIREAYQNAAAYLNDKFPESEVPESPRSLDTDRNVADLWGLYPNPKNPNSDVLNWRLPPQPSGVHDTRENFNPEALLCRLNRDKQDVYFVDLMEKEARAPMVLFGSYEHCPELYIERLKRLVVPGKFQATSKEIGYDFYLNYRSYEALCRALQIHFKIHRNTTVQDILNDPINRDKLLIFYTTILFKDFCHHGKRLVEDHHKFWQEEFRNARPEQNAIAILKLTAPYGSKKTFFWDREKTARKLTYGLENEEGPRNFVLPELKLIEGSSIENWMDNVDQKSPLAKVFKKAEVRRRFAQLERKGRYALLDINNLTKELCKNIYS